MTRRHNVVLHFLKGHMAWHATGAAERQERLPVRRQCKASAVSLQQLARASGPIPALDVG